MSSDRGLLIVFEGLDQSGKQTQAERLRDRLVAAGHRPRDGKPEWQPEQVRRVAIPEAVLYFGTDHEDYNRETQELFSATPWLEMLNPNAEPTEGIQTNFEIKYRKVGKPVYRCVLKVNKE